MSRAIPSESAIKVLKAPSRPFAETATYDQSSGDISSRGRDYWCDPAVARQLTSLLSSSEPRSTVIRHEQASRPQDVGLASEDA